MSRNYSSISEEKTLAANVTEASTTLTVNESTTGLPTVPFVFVINPDTALEEAVLATVKSGSTYTITRNIEGGGVKSHTIGQSVRHMIVGSDLQLVHDHIDNTTTAHGATGAVVGTTNTQTLTNKTLTSPKINENVALTASSTELNVLDGIPGTLTATELGYVDGVTSAIQTQLNTIVNTTIPNATPTGTVVMWVTGTAPTGWILCQGQEVLVSSYTALDGVLGTTYGARTNGSGAAGTTHFRVPDLRGRAPIGAGTGRNVADSADLATARTLGTKVSDAQTVTLDTTQIPSHSHPGQVVFGIDQAGGSGGIDDTTVGNSQPNTGNTGGGLAHENTQPSTVINFIIKS